MQKKLRKTSCFILIPSGNTFQLPSIEATVLSKLDAKKKQKVADTSSMKIVNSFLCLNLFHHFENILRNRIVQDLQGYKDFVCRNIIPHSRCSRTIDPYSFLILGSFISKKQKKRNYNEIKTCVHSVLIPCIPTARNINKSTEKR